MKFFNKIEHFNRVYILVVAVIHILFGQTTIIKSPQIKGQVRWSGNIKVLGDVTVARGARLIIDPGTVIKFATQDLHKSGTDPTRCELIVKGTLFARGQIDKKIIFTSAAKQPKMHDWYGIKILNFDQPAQFEYVVVEYAYNGFDIKKCNPLIRYSQIRYNYNAGLRIAVRSRAKLIGNIIQDNGYAGVICETAAEPVLTDNVITKNQIGVIVFGTAKPNLGDLNKGSPNQGRNGLFENYEYDFYNHSNNLIKAEGNSWGTEEKEQIMAHIFDRQDSPQYGPVDFNPIIGNIDLDQKILIAQQGENYRQSNEPLTGPDSMLATTQAESLIEKRAKIPEIPLESDSLSMMEPIRLSGFQTQAGETTLTEAKASQAQKSNQSIDFSQVFLSVFLDHGVKVKKKVAPIVSNPERGMNDHGNVIVKVVVGRNGLVEKAEILKSLNYYYDQLALEAAKKFVFEPGTVKGVKVRFSTSLLFKF